jgi:hypothetical protein
MSTLGEMVTVYYGGKDVQVEVIFVNHGETKRILRFEGTYIFQAQSASGWYTLDRPGYYRDIKDLLWDLCAFIWGGA